MKHSIGIDFGTTKTMVSYLNPATGRPELVRLGRDRDSIPTTVHVDESGEYLFGEDADDMIETDPEGYCRAFKLHLGEAEPVLPRSNETAESLAIKFLRHVKEECEQTVFHGETIDTTTITFPVKFSPARRESLKRAAEAAGCASISFVPEPEAAGTAFLRDNPTDKFSRALVLDWGGGTLDIAIISRNESGVIHADRRCAEGRDDIGGEEMDRLLLVAENNLWKEAFGTPLIQSEEDEPGLLRDTEKIKIGLSRKDSVIFRKGPKKLDVSREQFRQLIDGMLDDAVQLVQTALANNKKQGNPDPDAILLIGGTSLCPAIREAMEKNFPTLRVLAWHHSHEAVALGATAVETPDQVSADQSAENHKEEPNKALVTSEEKTVPENIATIFKRKYEELRNGPYPQIGQPAPPYQLPDGGWQMDCRNWAAITLRPGETTPYAVTGPICTRWYIEGGVYNEKGEKGWLGHPTSNEHYLEDKVNESLFEGGRITMYTTTHETFVHKDQRDTGLTFKKPKGTQSKGATSTFSSAQPSMPKQSQTEEESSLEPYAVTGCIRDRWIKEGGATGRLGHPISGVCAYTGASFADYVQKFEGGHIFWNSDNGMTFVEEQIPFDKGEEPQNRISDVNYGVTGASQGERKVNIQGAAKGVADWVGQEIKQINWEKTAYLAWRGISRAFFGG